MLHKLSMGSKKQTDRKTERDLQRQEKKALK